MTVASLFHYTIPKMIKKDKIIIDFLISSPLGLSETQKFYITHLYFLPTPYIAKDIIPPNKA